MPRDTNYWHKYVESLKSERVLLESLWEEIRKHYAPYDSAWYDVVPGERRGHDIHSSLPVQLLDKYLAHTYSWLYPLNEDYFSLLVEDETMMKRRRVIDYLEFAERVIYRVFARANFRNGTWLLHKTQGTYGTGSMFMAYEGNGQFRFQSRPLVETYLSENESDEVDTVVRRFKFSIKKILQMWPDAKVNSERIRERANQPERLEEKLWVIHVVTTRQDEETFNPDHNFISLYFLEADKTPLNLVGGMYRGFQDFPYVIARADKDAVTPYGYSRAAMLLADTKTYDKLTELRLKKLSKNVDPPMLIRQKKLLNRLRYGPGAINEHRSDNTRNDFIPLESGSRFDQSALENERQSQTLADGFFDSTFSFRARRTGPNITAQEIDAVENSGQRLAVPLISRQENEVLQPMVMFTFINLLRDGLLPAPPPELQGQRMMVKATGPLALDQQMGKVFNAERFLRDYMQLAGTQLGEQIAETVNMEDLARNMAEVLNIWPTSIRTPKEIAAIREQRLQEEQAMKLLQGGQAGSEIARNLAGAAKQ